MRESTMTDEQRILLESIKDALMSAPQYQPERWGHEYYDNPDYQEDLYDYELAEYIKTGISDCF
ncbi:MAG: hypothetical protein EOM35_09030 [Negativicutes bacterium]|nr:hypothetical protein [Negativicutes bacterium]